MGSVQSELQFGISVLIVGAGIGGLAAAVSLSRKGHHVTVLEAKPALNEFGASIGILSNGVKIFKAWGLEDKFRPVVTKNKWLDVRDGASNERLGRFPHNAGNTADIVYGGEVWNIHRADYQRVLAASAQENGARIMFNADVVSVDINSTPPAVILEDGRRLTADLIVGADGMRSAVRKSIPATSHVQPKKLFEQCWRATVPKDRMRNNPKLAWLLDSEDEMCFTIPGKYVLTWPLPPDRPYDVVTCIVRESDVPPGLWGVKADPVAMKKDFQDFCPEIRTLLDQIDVCVQWALAELPPLATCRSANGAVVLLGDAFHAMIPHAASGGNSAIEDAAVLGECVEFSYRHSRSIADATGAYERIRKPRVERMQTASHEGYGFLSAGGEAAVLRNEMLREQTAAVEELKMPESERRAQPVPRADMHAMFPSVPFRQWLQGHDVIAEARRWCAENV